MVKYRIPIGKGGRPIFDNLIVLCEEHSEQQDQRNRFQLRNKLNINVKHRLSLRK